MGEEKHFQDQFLQHVFRTAPSPHSSAVHAEHLTLGYTFYTDFVQQVVKLDFCYNTLLSFLWLRQQQQSI